MLLHIQSNVVLGMEAVTVFDESATEKTSLLQPNSNQKPSYTNPTYHQQQTTTPSIANGHVPRPPPEAKPVVPDYEYGTDGRRI